MPGYVDVGDMKAYLRQPISNDEDVILGELISIAKDHIDSWCGRHFNVVTQTRYFDQDAVDMLILDERYHEMMVYTAPRLSLDDDLIAVSGLTNGDGTTIVSSNYRLMPRNSTPKQEIILLNGLAWAFTNIWSEIAVTGTWGYGSTVPDSVALASRLLVSKWFRYRNVGWIDEFGNVPSGDESRHPARLAGTRAMPVEVLDLLSPFKKIAGY